VLQAVLGPDSLMCAWLALVVFIIRGFTRGGREYADERRLELLSRGFCEAMRSDSPEELGLQLLKPSGQSRRKDRRTPGNRAVTDHPRAIAGRNMGGLTRNGRPSWTFPRLPKNPRSRAPHTFGFFNLDQDETGNCGPYGEQCRCAERHHNITRRERCNQAEEKAEERMHAAQRTQ
jgi:hypothetical protein